jgi:hypothetical protein
MKTYLFSYRYEGANYAFEIPAESAEDARRRVARLQYATYDGELVAKVPVVPALTGVTGILVTVLARIGSWVKG